MPFLKDRSKLTTTLLDRRNGNRIEDLAADQDSTNSNNHDRDLEDAVSDLLVGIERKSIPDIRDALRKAFECLESQPHEEYEQE